MSNASYYELRALIWMQKESVKKLFLFIRDLPVRFSIFQTSYSLLLLFGHEKLMSLKLYSRLRLYNASSGLLNSNSCLQLLEMSLTLSGGQFDFVLAKVVIKDFEQTSPEVGKVLIKCIVEGHPSPGVTWYLGNTRLPDKRNYPDYDVTAAASLRVPIAAVVLHAFLCNCSNPLNSVAKLAKGKFLYLVTV